MTLSQSPLTLLADENDVVCFGNANSKISEMLRAADLRPTRQRVALTRLIYAKGHRHISAEQLHEEAIAENVAVSLATVYNTLHQFKNAGLLLAVVIDSARTYFDTNTDHHHHFYFEGENQVLDVPADQVQFGQMPEPPEGMEIAKIDVIIRLRRKK